MLFAAISVVFLALIGIVLVTAKKPQLKSPNKHLFPTLTLYAAVAASISMSLLSPRLTSTSVALVFDNTATNAVARLATGIALAVFVAAVVISIAKKTRIPALASAMIAYGLLGFISALINGQPLELGMGYIYCLIAGVALTATWSMAEALPVIRRCLRAYVWLSLILMLIGPALAFWDVQGRELFGIQQLAGVTTHPNGLGTVAAVAIFAELFRSEALKNPRRVHLFAALVVLALTQSRGAWVAAALGLIFWMVGRAKGSTAALSVPLMMIVIAGSVAFQNQIMGWLEEGTDARDLSTLNGRTLIWEQALAPVSDSPWVGHGPLVFDIRYRWEALGLADDAGHSNSHNQLIQTLLERGWFGLIVLAVFVFLLLRAAWKLPLNYRGPALAIAMIFVSRFAVETPLYISTASLNGALLLLLVTLFTTKPDAIEGLGAQSQGNQLGADVVHTGLRSRCVGSGSRYAGGLDYGSRAKEGQLRR